MLETDPTPSQQPLFERKLQPDQKRGSNGKNNKQFMFPCSSTYINALDDYPPRRNRHPLLVEPVFCAKKPAVVFFLFFLKLDVSLFANSGNMLWKHAGNSYSAVVSRNLKTFTRSIVYI